LSAGDNFSATIGYLGTWLHTRGFSFDFVNSFQDEKEELAQKLTAGNILTIAITTTFYTSVFPILEIMKFIKKYNQTARIIIGGPFVSTQVITQDFTSLDYLFKLIKADFYVNSSQGEAALANIIDALKNNLPLEQINNIYYKAENHRYISTPTSREDNKLAENMVNWTLFSQKVGSYVNVRTGISCPFSCAFCGFPQHAGQYQTADVEAVERELNLLDQIESVTGVHFVDDTFNVPQNRFKSMLRMFIKNNYKFKWICNFRCQFADREMVQLMKEAGCAGVFLGLESGSEKILKNMNKSASLEKYREGIVLLKEYDILTFGSFIIGFPGETPGTVQDTTRLIEESGIDFYRAQLWYCEHITPIWKEREKYNITGSQFEWQHQTMDSRQAPGLIENMFLNIHQSLWVPQYNFDFNKLFYLLNRGLPAEQVRDFLKAFNNGIKEKLLDPSSGNISFKTVQQLKKAIGVSAPAVEPVEEFGDIVDKYNAALDI
jgi:radical SAM PhpK family P-methyltransferase